MQHRLYYTLWGRAQPNDRQEMGQTYVFTYRKIIALIPTTRRFSFKLCVSLVWNTIILVLNCSASLIQNKSIKYPLVLVPTSPERGLLQEKFLWADKRPMIMEYSMLVLSESSWQQNTEVACHKIHFSQLPLWLDVSKHPARRKISG